MQEMCVNNGKELRTTGNSATMFVNSCQRAGSGLTRSPVSGKLAKTTNPPGIPFSDWLRWAQSSEHTTAPCRPLTMQLEN